MNKLTNIYTLGVGLIVVGLCIRYGGEQFMINLYQKKYNDTPKDINLKMVKYSGVGLYIFGWVTIAICLSMKHKNNRILKYSILSVIVVSAIWSVLEFKKESFIFQPKLPLISCSVLMTSLVALISLKYKIKDIILLVFASILIVVAEYVILPYQRKYNVQDGIGIPLIILGWIIFYHVFNGENLNQILSENIPFNLIE